MADYLIRTEQLSLTLADRLILNNINLHLKPREIVTLIGPNGAGKTSLVRLVLGLLKPSVGQIIRRPHLTIGYMPQKLHIDASLPLTVKRFLSLTGCNTKDVLTALDRTGVAHLTASPIQRLSGGETQRVLLARALLRHPNLLVLDEPAQGVDVAGQAALYQLIGEIRDETGCGVLMVSHDLHLVMAATDSVICLNQHICCHGHPEIVTSDPAYLELFGRVTPAAIAVYTHHHDHRHDIHGNVVGGHDHACSHDHHEHTKDSHHA